MSTPKNPSPVRWWDPIAAITLIFAVLMAATRLVATDWTTNLGHIRLLALFGVTLGFALGYSSFSWQASLALGSVYGLFAIPWQLGLTLGAGIPWSDRLLSLGGRLGHSLLQFVRQEYISDPLLFLLIIGIVFWFISAYAGFTLVRKGQPWRAVLPLGITMMIIQNYDPLISSRIWFIAAFLFCTLILVARSTYLKNRMGWQDRKAHLPIYVSFDITRAAVLIALVVVLFAWNFPAQASQVDPVAGAWQNLTKPWLDLREHLNKALSSLRTVGGVSDYYGESLPLGRGNVLTDTVIVTVEGPVPLAGMRYYWRQRTYDTYSSSAAWLNTRNVSQNLVPTDPAIDLNAFDIGRVIGMFEFNVAATVRTYYTVAQPEWISRPAEAFVAINDDGSLDLAALRANNPLLPGDVYRVEASLANVSILDLQTTGTEYPNWVTERYLQLPEELPQRMIDLAFEITAGLDTPYEKAQAVTTWLRKNITYSGTIPAPPEGRDPVDWVLFDLKQGFCNYYATAEILMLRAVGVPARMAVGYAEGERFRSDEQAADNVPGGGPQGPPDPGDAGEDDDVETYVVRQKDAHAWPEVFFSGVGWVEFEPTANQYELVRPAGEIDLTNPVEQAEPIIPDDSLDSSTLDNSFPEDNDEPKSFLSAERWAELNLGPWLAGLGLILGLLAATLSWRSLRLRGIPPMPVLLERGLERVNIEPPQFIRLWARYAKLPPLAKAYMELNRALSRLKATPKPSETPAERAARLQSLLPPEDETTVSLLLKEYHTGAYSAQPGDLEAAQNAGKSLRWLSISMVLRRWLARFQAPEKRPTYIP